MNKNQKIVLFIIAGILVVMLLFPPFHFVTSRATINRGYNFILSPPVQATINTETLLVQCLVVAIVGGMLWFAFKDKE